MSHTVRRLVQDMLNHDAHSGAAQGADPRFMREHNRLLVLNCVREHEPITRVAIARLTGLSRTTISTIMDGLLKEGLVREGETLSAAPVGGRRPILVHFNAAAGVMLGVDMGRSHLTILVCDLAARILAQRSGPFDVDRGPDECLPWLISELRATLDEQHIPWCQVVGVGVGIPGPMDASLMRTIEPPRMPGWDGVDVRSVLARELAVPVFLDNDANLGALGECRYGAGVGVPDLTYVKVGTGIGGGLVMAGRIYRGSVGSAGEIGHVTVDPDGPLCDCGNRGCLEAMVDAQLVPSNAAVRESPLVAITPPAEVALTPIAPRAPEVTAVVNAALQGDLAAREAVAHAGELIGVVLAGLVNLINPSLILIGGSVARAGDLLLDPIRRTIAARSFSVAWANINVRVGDLGGNATALGGVALVLDAAFGAATVAARPSHKHTNRSGNSGTDSARRETDPSEIGRPHGPASRAARAPPGPRETATGPPRAP